MKQTHYYNIYLIIFYVDTPNTEIYTLSLHDALPICKYAVKEMMIWLKHEPLVVSVLCGETAWHIDGETLVIHSTKEQRDRKSTRLNSSHMSISYAVFCLKKKTKRN